MRSEALGTFKEYLQGSVVMHIIITLYLVQYIKNYITNCFSLHVYLLQYINADSALDEDLLMVDLYANVISQPASLQNFSLTVSGLPWVPSSPFCRLLNTTLFRLA